MEQAKVCDFCDHLSFHWVDGKTSIGPWANMCMPCYKTHGIGLGMGKGQEYKLGEKVKG